MSQPTADNGGVSRRSEPRPSPTPPVTSCAVSEIIGSYTRGLYRLDLRREANIRMADDEAHRDLKLNKRRPKVGCDR